MSTATRKVVGWTIAGVPAIGVFWAMTLLIGLAGYDNWVEKFWTQLAILWPLSVFVIALVVTGLVISGEIKLDKS